MTNIKNSLFFIFLVGWICSPAKAQHPLGTLKMGGVFMAEIIWENALGE